MNLEQYLSPTIMLFCVLVGFLIKNSPYFEKIPNKYIPPLTCIIGIVVYLVSKGSVSIENILVGGCSGWASVGAYETVKHFLETNGEAESNGEE